MFQIVIISNHVYTFLSQNLSCHPGPWLQSLYKVGDKTGQSGLYRKSFSQNKKYIYQHLQKYFPPNSILPMCRTPSFQSLLIKWTNFSSTYISILFASFNVQWVTEMCKAPHNMQRITAACNAWSQHTEHHHNVQCITTVYSASPKIKRPWCTV